jgi:phosphatidylinositol alpha-1,6-mannosyltransferase
VRILYVSHTHPEEGAILENVGGMQRVSQQLVSELDRKDPVTLKTNTINAAGRGMVGLTTFFFLIRQLVELPVQARDKKADVILFSSMVTACLAWFIRRRVYIPMVTINHGRDVTLPVRLYQWFLPKVFNSLDGVISVSQATREECIRRGMHPDKGVALPNGFDMEKLNDFPDKETARLELQKRFGISLKGRFMLLTVGRQVKRKGHEWFIRNVFPKLSEDTVYVTIGDGPEMPKVEQAARESTCKDRIILLGRQPDAVLKQAYAASDLFIMPNVPVEGDMEGFGIVMLEANMARTPAVASDLEGIKDVIAQGKNGYLIPPLDDIGFADQINRIIKSNRLDTLSSKTRYYVQEQFSWERVADQYIDFLSKVIDRFEDSRLEI